MAASEVPWLRSKPAVLRLLVMWLSAQEVSVSNDGPVKLRFARVVGKWLSELEVGTAGRQPPSPMNRDRSTL